MPGKPGAKLIELTQAYVVGLLTDAEVQVPTLRKTLIDAQGRSSAVDGELGRLLQHIEANRAALKSSSKNQNQASKKINVGNMRVAVLHQEIATFQKKAADIQLEMKRLVDDPDLRRRLRRGRAQMRIHIEDHQQEIEGIRATVEEQRNTLQEADATNTEAKNRRAVLIHDLDALQSQLPSPYLYTALFEASAAAAHCRLYLDGSIEPWKQDMRDAIEWVTALHRDLRAGKYRLDQNSDLVGGRATATGEAMYGAIIVDQKDLARALFASATDDGLYFHEIFNVFRVWCLGLYLSDRIDDLRHLLRIHQYAEGLRGAYAQAFIGLLKGDATRVRIGVGDITKHEWALWQAVSRMRGGGVVNLGAAAIIRLAHKIGISVDIPGPTVPKQMVAHA